MQLNFIKYNKISYNYYLLLFEVSQCNSECFLNYNFVLLNVIKLILGLIKLIISSVVLAVQPSNTLSYD